MIPQQAESSEHELSVEESQENHADNEYLLSEDFEPLKNAKIMMIDDELMTMKVMQNLLKGVGYREFMLIEDSVRGMQQLREYQPDVLLLDVVMPEISGFDILKQLRADSSLSHMPVIILTSSTDADTKLKALDLGASDFLSKPVDPSELALRVRNTLAAKAYQDQLSYYDTVTNLPNRRLFEERLEWAVAKAKDEDSQLTLLHVAHDEFKRVCDNFGPKVGDDILRQITERIVSNLKPSDVGNHNQSDRTAQIDIFYLSSASFTVLISGIEGSTSAPLIAQRILSAMNSSVGTGASEIYLTPSIGVARFPDDADTDTLLVKRAIGASGQATGQNGGQIQFYSPEMNKFSLERLRIEADLRRAVEKQEFKLLYQPKIDVATGSIVGAEALIRWFTESGDMVSPIEFIPVAEETGLILPIGEWVIREALEQIVRWRVNDIVTKVAINISGRQFFESDLVLLLSELLTEKKLQAECLTLEITESFMIGDVKKAIEILTKLRALGLEISIDDFGTGYSSLSYLKSFKADELKIDRSFITDIVNSREDQALVSGVTYLAHELDLRVCAEGVENADQLAILKRFNVDLYQGYYFDKPLPPEIFESRYKSLK